MLVVFDILSVFLTMFWYLSLKLTSLKKKKSYMYMLYVLNNVDQIFYFNANFIDLVVSNKSIENGYI